MVLNSQVAIALSVPQASVIMFREEMKGNQLIPWRVGCWFNSGQVDTKRFYTIFTYL
jgi:hypothetical protein